MLLSHFLTVLRQSYRPLSVATALVAGFSLPLLGSAASDEEAVVTNVGRFEIPFEVEGEDGKQAEGFAVLFGSQDGGRTWDQLQSVPANRGAFVFTAPRDGKYSFAIRMTDAQGNLETAIEGSEPEMEVVVDTVAPKLQLEIIEVTPGQALVNWTSSDSSIVGDSLTLECTEGLSGNRKPIQFTPSGSGQVRVAVASGSMISVRASIMDQAGNRGEATAQYVSRPVVSSSAAPGLAAPAAPPALPLGPSPFSANPMHGPVSVHGSSTQPKLSQPVTGSGSFNSHAFAGYPSDTPAAPGLPDALSPATIQSPAFPANAIAGEKQLVNDRVFDLDYQIEDVGPSGVSSVELFVTEDGGQQWFRYGTDPDMKSPFQVDSMGEGTFGFAVRIRNGLGISDTPPQPGQTPEVVVIVDQTPPVIELSQPSIRLDSFGSIQLNWRVNEANASTAPVRLEYAVTPTGPWTPVFDWQADQGGYQFAIRPGTPSSLYFRLLARDAAGNVASSQTAQPVVVDLKKPVGRILRVQAASHSGMLPVQN
jgi:hypothetical protein